MLFRKHELRMIFFGKTAYPLREIAGLIDVAISLLLQLVDDLPLFLGLLPVVLNVLLQVLLGLLMKADKMNLLLSGTGCFQHAL